MPAHPGKKQTLSEVLFFYKNQSHCLHLHSVDEGAAYFVSKKQRHQEQDETLHVGPQALDRASREVQQQEAP